VLLSDGLEVGESDGTGSTVAFRDRLENLDRLCVSTLGGEPFLRDSIRRWVRLRDRWKSQKGENSREIQREAS